MKPAVFLSLGFMLAMAAPPPVHAADPQLSLRIQLEEELSIPDESGNLKVVRKKVASSEPGDVLVYTLVYTNNGGAAVADAKVEDPVPAGTILLPGSVLGEEAEIRFSVDGGKTYAPFPVEVEVEGPDGAKVRKKAPADSYTHIRWTAKTPLGPGESRSASFKVIVQ